MVLLKTDVKWADRILPMSVSEYLHITIKPFSTIGNLTENIKDLEQLWRLQFCCIVLSEVARAMVNTQRQTAVFL